MTTISPKLVIVYRVSTSTLTSPQVPTLTNTATPTATPSNDNVLTLQPNGTAGVDTRLASNQANTNFGTDDKLYVGESNQNSSVHRSLLRFDLSGIPANATITSATLSLWLMDDFSDNAGTFSAYRVKRAWTEDGATWNAAASGSNWNTPGLDLTADAEGTAIASRAMTASEANGEKQWTLDPAKVQEWVSGTLANNGLLLRAGLEQNDQYRFASSDYILPGQRPQLVIHYTLPTPTPTATHTPTQTPTPTNTPTATATALVVPPPALSVSFGYDPLDRLESVTYSDGQGLAYGYDAAGNRLSEIRSPGGMTSYTYATDSNRLQTVNGLSQTYDANGNMIERNVTGTAWMQTFDGENRLVAVSNQQSAFSFAYDGDGNRVKQTAPNGDFTIYIAGLYEASYASTGTLLNTKVYYAFGGKVVAMRDNSVLYYLHTDHLGSTRVVTDGTGQAVSLNAYYPFGASKYSSGARPTDMDFTGQRLDATGLNFYNARYYDSATGRFVSADTVVPNPGGTQGFNRYAYSANNPMRYTDPSGNCAGTFEDHENAEAECWQQAVQMRDTYGFDFALVSQFGLDRLNMIMAAYYLLNSLFPAETSAFVENFNTLSTARGPWAAEVDALGFRLGGQLYFVGGVEGGLEMIINFRSSEVSYFGVAGAGFGFAAGWTGTAEAMALFDLPNNAAYREYSMGISIAGAIHGVGVTAGYASNTEVGSAGRRAQEVRAGVASGYEFALVINVSYAIELLTADFRNGTVRAVPDFKWNRKSDPAAYDPWPW